MNIQTTIRNTSTTPAQQLTGQAVKSDSPGVAPATDSVVLGSTQTANQEAKLKELSLAQRHLDQAKSQAKEVILRDEYEVYRGRRNSKHGVGMSPFLGLAAGLAVGVVLASSTNNPAVAIPTFFAGPVLGFSGGLMIENSAQNRYMNGFNAAKSRTEAQVSKWKKEVDRLSQELQS